MRWLAKPFLWLLTCIVPVFIAACYGAGFGVSDGPYSDGGSGRLTRAKGRVLNAITGLGIKGIHVICLWQVGTDDRAADDTYSLPGDGAFEVWYEENSPCDVLRFEDVDGDDNGGHFAAHEEPFAETEGEIVELVPEP
ncbi:MAG: hypothetical protein PHU25_18575 [Deltaproteobacteria bacterium]|nr:hypothetical protein [Deltaproteobacteria bacterium]